MGGSLGGGSVFGGKGGSIGFGGFLDDLFGDTEDVAGEAGNVATTPGATATTDATVIPGTPGKAAAQSPGALPKFGSCPSGMVDDPKNPSAFCIPDPKKNFACPTGQVFDYVKGACAPFTPDYLATSTGTIAPAPCPYGTKLVGKTCVSIAGGGAATGGGTKPATTLPTGTSVDPGTNALSGSSVPTWAIVLGGVALVGGLGTAIYAKTHNGKMPWSKGRR
jgi:hypothetical protein